MLYASRMAVMGLVGVLWGKRSALPSTGKTVAIGDRVNRQFVAERPDQLWVADFASAWQGFVYVAFIIDVFAGYIVGWRVSSPSHFDIRAGCAGQALLGPSSVRHHPSQR